MREMRRKWLAGIFLLSILWPGLSGCGDSGSERVGTSAPPIAPATTARLSGVWGGYFPGSSPQNPQHGIELHFDRPSRGGALHAAGFIHRSDFQGSRHHVKVEERGSTLKLTFDAGTADEGVFEGTFIDQWTVRGTYTNAARGETFGMELKDEEALPLQSLRPASKMEAPLAQQSSDDGPPAKLVLRLNFTAKSDTVITQDNGPITVNHQLDFGYGAYFDSFPYQGRWSDHTTDPLGFADRTKPYSVDWFSGVSTVRTMVFYPDWVLLELFPPPFADGSDDLIDGINYQVGSLELPWTSLVDRDGSKLAEGSWVAQTYDNDADGSWDYFKVEDLKLSYEPRDYGLDTKQFEVSVQDPGYQNLVVDGQAYSVPGNTIKVLRYLGFAIPFE